MKAWKTNKLSAITNEVNEFHPLLTAIFTNDKTISRFEYTHGPAEMGADFVLARIDQTLGDENYVGVIAKCGKIKQDHTDIKRQIDECAVERYFDSGKRKIYLNEVWIVCNGSVSNGAERKIHEEYKSRNIKFIDINKLEALVETNYPQYWNEIPTSIGLYLQDTLAEINKSESYNSLAAGSVSTEVTQELCEIERTSPGSKLSRFKKHRSFTLDQALERTRLLLIEGGMGSGKSTIFRRHVRNLCDPNTFQQHRTLPKIIHFAEIADDVESKIDIIVESFGEDLRTLEGRKLLLLIDGVDEVRSASKGSLAHTVDTLARLIEKHENLTIALGSRQIWTIEEGEDILHQAMRFRIQPLSFDQICKVVEHNCHSLGISEKLRRDLAKSSLLRAIPRTPMSAILLAKVLSANAKEIPQTLPELYSKYVELALGRWDIGKGLMTEREYPVIVTVLSHVAKYMLDNELQELAISEVLQMLSDYTKSREGLPAPSLIFNNLSERSEIVFIDKEKSTFCFRHKSFAEYLVALHQKEIHGRNAPFINPFEGYRLGVEYFYLGLLQDSGERIEKLSELKLTTEREKMLRLLNFANLMLAAYQTEYAHIERAVYRTVIEITKYFLDVRSGRVHAALSKLPELQFFAVLSHVIRESFEYSYFLKALEDAQLQCQYDKDLTEDERSITSFFVDFARAGLNVPDAFQFLTTRDLSNLPWVVKLSVYHAVKDGGVTFDFAKNLQKRIGKTMKNNPELSKYIRKLYHEPMDKLALKL